MKNVVGKIVKVLCIIVIILDMLGSVALFYTMNKYDALGIFINNWQNNLFNLSNSDARAMNSMILFLVIPIVILLLLPKKKRMND
ncbi:hypothetical protein UAW_03241 [Enterococcus haemoperoxidus ATCC BAA-382]|uniref:Uncharacterized protein n=1 Tax=Enterococcus haemoperoxidus ATCC BAA-382 TaxID=1158608 RepID=R2SHA2_9ENTE|nr:hypothetical protein [Enterococcus haemoperoxidus]EOH92256.1 hypothetical protein UAW_03241 [Enterococcus haemoperoxidus ATCC BAA-382]EOT61941.1 hypothetical protein I583_00924 [Enterococcus haemoperoxidus ATCC BAA-382]OJG54150.1 hypothetical protein RV06_GL003103 [Enterococcus haemoperoxidus]